MLRRGHYHLSVHLGVESLRTQVKFCPTLSYFKILMRSRDKSAILRIMNHHDIINRMYNIHLLIEQEATGTPDEFAARLRISRRQLYNVLDELKDYGSPHKYSRRRHTFYYAGEFEFVIKAFTFKFNNKK